MRYGRSIREHSGQMSAVLTSCKRVEQARDGSVTLAVELPPSVPEPEPVPFDPPGPVIVPEPEPVPHEPPGPVIVPEPQPPTAKR